MKTDPNKKTETQPQPPSPEIDATLSGLEQRATAAAPAPPTDPNAGSAGTSDPAAAQPEAEYVPKGPPLPEGFDRDRPWGIWVQMGDKITQRVINNWDFTNPVEIEGNKVDGHMLYTWGTEAWLTKVLPNGIIDLEKYPLVVALIGLGLIAVNNLQTVIDAQGNERWKFKPMRKTVVKAGGAQPGGQADVAGAELQTKA